MTEELKTLKDFDCKGCYCQLAPELKAEAVKWVKEMEDGEMETDDRFFDYDSNSNEILINWIKHFFNLTDDDIVKKEEDVKW